MNSLGTSEPHDPVNPWIYLAYGNVHASSDVYGINKSVPNCDNLTVINDDDSSDAKKDIEGLKKSNEFPDC